MPSTPRVAPSPHPEPVRTSLSSSLPAFALALAPVAIALLILFHEMRNVPMQDDYQAIVSFVLILKQLPTLASRLLFVVAAQHDEYKLIFEHAVIGLQWALTGRLNFTFLILIGDAFLLATLWLLWKHSFASEPRLSRRLLLFAPVCYLFFQLNYAENLDWAMCGMQTMPVIFFSLAAMHLLLKSGRSLPLACLCAFLACLSSANGFLVAPIGLFLLGSPRQWPRLWRRIALWTVPFALALWMYLYRYIPITRSPYDPNVSILNKCIFFLSFLGSAIENMHHYPVRNGSVVLGLFIMAIFLAACRTRFYAENPFAFYSTVWFLISAALVARVRSGLGMDMSLTSRYKIYSDLFLIFCYLYAVSRLEIAAIGVGRKRLLYTAVLAATMLQAAASDLFGYRFLDKRRVRAAEGLDEYVANPASNPPMISLDGTPILSSEPGFTRVVLSQAIERGIYTIPPPAKR